MAGKISYIAPVDYGQGKIFGKKNKWIAVKRTFGSKMKGCAFQGERDMLNHPITDDERQARLTFSTVTKNVAKRIKKNSATYEQDSVAFLAQRDQPGGIQTFKKWLWEDEKSKL